MTSNLKRFLLPAVAASVTFCVAILFVTLFRRLDTVPRVRIYRCKNEVSVTVQERRVGWFDYRTQQSVRMVDRSGLLVSETTSTGPEWLARSFPQTVEYYCDERNWLYTRLG